jgi:hypothetical protein
MAGAARRLEAATEGQGARFLIGGAFALRLNMAILEALLRSGAIGELPAGVRTRRGDSVQLLR